MFTKCARQLFDFVSTMRHIFKSKKYCFQILLFFFKKGNKLLIVIYVVSKYRSILRFHSYTNRHLVSKKFFYNVFRATEYKTTSLPAALNQARRIDTLLGDCIVMHCINRSHIYWRPSLFNVLCHKRGQITNTNKFTSIIQTFSLS